MLAAALRSELHVHQGRWLSDHESTSHSEFRRRILGTCYLVQLRGERLLLAVVKGFVGRDADVKQLVHFCLNSGPSTARICILHGEHGCGKTALLAKACSVLTSPSKLLRSRSSEQVGYGHNKEPRFDVLGTLRRPGVCGRGYGG